MYYKVEILLCWRKISHHHKVTFKTSRIPDSAMESKMQVDYRTITAISWFYSTSKILGGILLVLTISTTLTLIQAQNEAYSSRCEIIQVPMCKGLIDYNATKLPNKFGHTTQAEAYWALQPWWPFIDAGCSDNLRRFLCGLYLPRCIGDDVEPQYPCKETCTKAKIRCKRQMRQQRMKWSSEFKCNHLLPKSSKACIKPTRERKKRANREYVLCEVNSLPLCRGIPFPQGSLPNLFLQGDLTEIDMEMRQYQPLIDSGCSKKLRLFLCGVYMPFCVPGSHVEDEVEAGGAAADHVVINAQPDVPFVVPCRELCQEVYDQCSGEYEQRTHGLPWPGKFHCHRYPSYVDRYDSNNMTSDHDITADDNGRAANRRGTSVPCTMPPFNYDGN